MNDLGHFGHSRIISQGNLCHRLSARAKLTACSDSEENGIFAFRVVHQLDDFVQQDA
jgi:hypothetical protein